MPKQFGSKISQIHVNNFLALRKEEPFLKTDSPHLSKVERTYLVKGTKYHKSNHLHFCLAVQVLLCG